MINGHGQYISGIDFVSHEGAMVENALWQLEQAQPYSYGVEVQPEVEHHFDNNVFSLSVERDIGEALLSYRQINEEFIKEFLRPKPNVIRFLRNASYALDETFQSASGFTLELVEGLDEGEPDKLFITIIVENEELLEKTFDKYDDFFMSWWCNEVSDVSNLVILGVG